MLSERKITESRIEDRVQMIELILGMEEWMKAGSPSYEEVKYLPLAIDDFITKINHCCQRDGMGTKLIKNHLYFHIPKYIELWGPPKGWDSAPNESHHKTEIKAPSRNTQQIAGSLIQQTAMRHSEARLVKRARSYFNLDVNGESRADSSSTNPTLGATGSKFEVRLGQDGDPTMLWTDKHRNQDKAFHPGSILKFCCETILPINIIDRGLTRDRRKSREPPIHLSKQLRTAANHSHRK